MVSDISRLIQQYPNGYPCGINLCSAGHVSQGGCGCHRPFVSMRLRMQVWCRMEHEKLMDMKESELSFFLLLF